MLVMPMSEALIRAQQKYEKERTAHVHFKLNLETDADIIRWLKSVPNKNGYLKELIRKDIKAVRNDRLFLYFPGPKKIRKKFKKLLDFSLYIVYTI